MKEIQKKKSMYRKSRKTRNIFKYVQAKKGYINNKVRPRFKKSCHKRI